MKYSQQALNVLTALSFKGIGKAWIIKHQDVLSCKASLIDCLNLSTKDKLVSLCRFNDKQAAILSELIKRKDVIDGLTTIVDEDFPIHRGTVKNSQKPVALFYQGDIRLLDPCKPSVAVIGLLDPDFSTEKSEISLVDELVSKNIIIVSGLANGCDAIAHKQAVIKQGKTVAVLPSSLHNILPRGNQSLAKEIVESGGLLVTEYMHDASSKLEFTARYQERDRLQALFSDAVILVASYAKNNQGNDSGARLAMEYALQYDIKRAVMYNISIDSRNPKYDLNRQLILKDTNIHVIKPEDTMCLAGNLLDKLITEKSKNIQYSLF
ncbi:DNA-processing protein DprA [Glaciecola sp. HTCC2999]|uniref:DNA-processing protein DprA n=1 Tax=Glaciecola sp. HTCC2999 TaxID=455436 RepID=UPI0000E0E615|nr:DNA-processing protein DprA [Glaciecola sp. HTCC2999]